MSAKNVTGAMFRQAVETINPAECLQQMLLAYTEYMKVAEQEQTKRRDIERWEKQAIASINDQRDFLMNYLDRSFDERAENFKALFCIVDRAIANGDNTQLALALNSITEIAKSSPFKELANLASVRAALDDPNHEWTF